MSIDKSGKWWIGSEPLDIREFLGAYTASQYGIQEFRVAKCPCGGECFYLEADGDEGFAARVCPVCARRHFICDSKEFRDAAKPEACRCVECGSDEANVGVGFSLYDDDGEVRWLHVGVRCASCGVLGCVAGWKVAYAPSRQLFDQV